MPSLEDLIRAIAREIAREEAEAVLDEFMPREWYTAEQAAAYLGVSRGHIYNLVAAGVLKRSGAKGHKLVFRRSELDAYPERSAGDG